MESLSNLFKISDVFKVEFDKIFPAQPFNKVNILNYVSICTEKVFSEVSDKYPDHRLKFINPVFIVDDEIFPAHNLPGDQTIPKLIKPFFDLTQTKTVIPISKPIIDSLLSGVCLFYGNTYADNIYKLFKTYNLDNIIANVAVKAIEIHDTYYLEDIKEMNIDVSRLSSTFHAFSSQLNITSDEDKVRLIKSLIVFKSLSNIVNSPLVISFVNKFNQTHSFFDCLLTFISEKPFDQDTLLDFAHIVEGISLPLANYDYNKSKGISVKTMAKRNSLKTMLEKSFKPV